MASTHKVKPTHKAVKDYYAALATYADQSVAHEGALRSAFQNLLANAGRKVGWMLIPELSLELNGHQIRPDGTFRDRRTEHVLLYVHTVLIECHLAGASRRRTITAM